MNYVENFLKSNNIRYVLHKHSAVYTCEEAEKYCSHIPGIPGKNLLLKDKKNKRFFLAVLSVKKRMDFKKFGEIVGETHPTFAKAEELWEKLGLDSGAVSPFGLLNDKNKEIEVYVERGIYDAEIVNFHPNENTASLELSREMFHKFLDIIEHKINVFDL